MPSALKSLGEARAISAREPVLLDDPRSLWIVERGKVEIFAVDLADGRAAGARDHYVTVPEDESFFGMDSGAYRLNGEPMGFGLLAVGQLATRVRRIPVAELRRLASEAPGSERVGRLLDRWIAVLAARLVADRRPSVDARLAKGVALSLREFRKISASREEVLWIPCRGQLFQQQRLPRTEALFPLAPGTWIEATEKDGTLVGRGTAELLARAELWRGLALFHEQLCYSGAVLRGLDQGRWSDRLRERTTCTAAAENETDTRLAKVLDPTLEVAPATATDDDRVFAAMRKVAEHQGIRLRKPPRDENRGTERDVFQATVAGIARCSGIRTRTVALRGEWWTRDAGPLLARYFDEDRDRPVALLPGDAGTYRCFDPEERTTERVSGELARQLDGFAQALYRSFPRDEVRWWDLIRFGMAGLGKDLRTLCFLGAALGLFGALVPVLTRFVYDWAIPEAQQGFLVQLTLALGLIAAATGVFRIVQAFAVLRIQSRMDYSVQAAVWDRLLKLPPAFFRRYSVGDLADRAAGIQNIRNLVAKAGVRSILGALSSLTYVLVMLYFDFRLAGLVVLLTAALVLLTMGFNLQRIRRQRTLFDLRGRVASLVLQLVTGLSKLRIAGAESLALRSWARRFAEQREAAFEVGRIKNRVAVLNSAYPLLSSTAIFAFIYVLRQQEDSAWQLSTGQFIAFISAYTLFTNAMLSLGDASVTLVETLPLYERLRPILRASPEVGTNRVHPGTLRGKIELNHVHFRYRDDGPRVLRDVSLTIEPGELVAFAGGSGSGKTTLLRLLLGFEKPEKGAVYYDEKNLADLDLVELRQQLGVVLQDSKVLPTDILRNIVGTSSRSPEEAWGAARMAALEEDIREMPMGLHTYVSEGGGSLSGGQRQRLLIARAIIDQPRILFLDEATSALDNRAQAIVTENLDRLQATRIVIAHRLSTIRNADRIYYLKDGAIAAQGTFEELMERDDDFAEMAERQRL